MAESISCQAAECHRTPDFVQMCRLAEQSLACPEAERQEKGRPLLDSLFDHLEKTGVLEAFQARPRRNTHLWDWEDLYRDEEFAVGLLRIHRHDPIPLHDHPGSTGVQITLMGRLHTDQFNLAANDDPGSHITTLHRVSSHTLKPGAITCFTPNHGSVHSLRSETDHSIQCCLLFNPYQESERRWFFPLFRAQQHADRMEVTSISRHRSQGGSPDENI